MAHLWIVSAVLTAYLLGALAGLFNHRKTAYSLSLLASLLAFPLAVYGIGGVHGEVVPFLPTEVSIDAFSALFLLVFAIVGSSLSLYLLSYSQGGSVRLTSMALNGALMSAFLFLITDSLERMTLAYELFAFFTFTITLASGIRRAEESARRYLWNTQVFGMVPLLLATGLAYSAVGSLHGLTFEGLSANAEKLPSPWLVYAFYISAALVRSGVFPLHTWVPSTYRRTPAAFVPVYLVGEAMGFYMLLRLLFFALPPSQVAGYTLALLGASSAFATLYSFREIRLKRKFSYHSIMDMGVSYFGLGTALVLGGVPGVAALLGSILHTLYQTVYKSAVFLGIGSIEHYGEEPNICSLRKLLRGHVMAFMIMLSALSLAAVPPLSSFVSRWLIYSAAFGTLSPYLWTMGLTIAFLGLFPLASVVQLRRINRLICKREVEREEIPLLLRASTGFLALTSLLMALFPVLLLPWLKASIEGFAVFPENLPHTLLSNPGTSIGGSLLLLSLIAGWKVGNIPTDRTSELLLIFYNVGDILGEAWRYLVWRGKEFYLHSVAPVIKVIPKHEIPLIEDYDDALDYPVRHLDEAMFSPLLRAIEWLAEFGSSERPDMNYLIGGFAIAMALLIVFLGVFA
ncbi:complex I subunit 5 family protein [Thermococcus sp.]|uniref:complex I subunit 5 family protein n=1 Tax=Thermococcus sp. TaxID=35749 RepID=UPI00261E30DC|nr:complex I subunit 5 family protein [Thermococcus sp.]